MVYPISKCIQEQKVLIMTFFSFQEEQIDPTSTDSGLEETVSYFIILLFPCLIYNFRKPYIDNFNSLGYENTAFVRESI